MEGEREIFASLVVLKHHLIAETIRKENEYKKTNVKALGANTSKDVQENPFLVVMDKLFE